jgi:hypothetical protein
VLDADAGWDGWVAYGMDTSTRLYDFGRLSMIFSVYNNTTIRIHDKTFFPYYLEVSDVMTSSPEPSLRYTASQTSVVPTLQRLAKSASPPLQLAFNLRHRVDRD